MKIELTPLENRILKVIVEATPEETEEARRVAAQRLGKQVHVPGFRPGKAPYPILLKHLNPVSLQEETIEVFLDKYYPEILEKEKIEPSDVGRLEKILSVEPLKLEIHIPLEPLVELCDYHSIRIPYEPPAIGDEDVEKVLEELRQQASTFEPVDRPIQEGDVAYIDLIAYRMEDGNRTDQIIVQEQNVPIQILRGDEEVWEYPFKGFSKFLVGKQVNDRLNVDHKFAEDDPSEKFKGLEVNFEVAVKEVKAQNLPELNDEFAQAVSEYSSLEELKNTIRTNLEKKSLEDYHKDYEQQVLDQIIQNSKIEYTLDTLEKERKAYLEDLDITLHRFGMDNELYKKMIGEEKFEKLVEEVAEERLKKELVLLEIAKKEKVKIDFEKVRENTQRILQRFLDQQQNVSLPRKKLEELTSSVSTNLMFDQVYENAYARLRQIAKGEAEVESESSEEERQTDIEESSSEIPTEENLDTSIPATSAEAELQNTQDISDNKPE